MASDVKVKSILQNSGISNVLQNYGISAQISNKQNPNPLNLK
jgi:hypothetical protein